MAEENVVTCAALLENADGAQLYMGTSRGLLVVANALLVCKLEPLQCFSFFLRRSSLLYQLLLFSRLF